MAGEALPAIVRPIWLDRTTKKSVTKEELKLATDEIVNDPDYARNGWTPETLAAYFKERKVAQSDSVLHRRPRRPTRTNGWHNPHRWRK